MLELMALQVGAEASTEWSLKFNFLLLTGLHHKTNLSISVYRYRSRSRCIFCKNICPRLLDLGEIRLLFPIDQLVHKAGKVGAN